MSVSEDWTNRMKQFYDQTVAPLEKRSCSGIRDDLKVCLLESDCVQVHKKTPKECLHVTDESIPEQCSLLRTTFFECKRSLLDNRQRFRGRKGY